MGIIGSMFRSTTTGLSRMANSMSQRVVTFCKVGNSSIIPETNHQASRHVPVYRPATAPATPRHVPVYRASTATAPAPTHVPVYRPAHVPMYRPATAPAPTSRPILGESMVWDHHESLVGKCFPRYARTNPTQGSAT